MKKITVCAFAAVLVGCSSPPKQTEPSGRLTPVYELQHELNERPMWRNDSELSMKDNQTKKNTKTGVGSRGRGNE